MTYRILAKRTALVLAGAVALSACTTAKTYEGFVADPAIVATIQPGLDNKMSVEAAMGKPSFIGTDNPNDWYYVSRTLGQLAFRTPRPKEHKVIHVRFGANDVVESVNERGLDTVASVNPNGDKTPTMGRNKSLFEELFGNIGGAGSTRTAGNSDPTRPD